LLISDAGVPDYEELTVAVNAGGIPHGLTQRFFLP
jgi:hypothetical protein